MSLWKIAWRSIQQRALASSLTGLSMALGVMLVVAVLLTHGVINRSFMNNSGLGYNILVGAKGGRLDLVLNAVYYLARPVENIPYSYYLEFSEGKLKPYVEKAIPLCLGDFYEGYRVVATTPAFFNDLDYGGNRYEFAEGRNFEPDEYFGAVVGATVARETGLKKGDEFQPSHGAGADAHKHDPFTVLGVLKPTGTPNDRALFINMEGFYLIEGHEKPLEEVEAAKAKAAQHGEHADDAKHEHADHHDDKHEHPAGTAEEPHGEHKHDEHPTGESPAAAAPQADTAAAEHAEDKHEHAEDKHEHAEDKHEHAEDKHAHDEHGHDEHAHGEHAHDEHGHHHHHGEHGHEHKPLPIEQREVTAVLLRTADIYSPYVIRDVNKDSVAQGVLPIREISTLFEVFVSPLRLILLALTVMIVIVSGIGILVSIYNSMNERQHEIAVIRALGAGRRKVMALVLLESILLSLAGGLAGWVLGHLLMAALNPWIVLNTGVSVGILQFVGYELVIIPGLILLASLVGYLPAMAAYRTDVAKALSASP